MGIGLVEEVLGDANQLAVGDSLGVVEETHWRAPEEFHIAVEVPDHTLL